MVTALRLSLPHDREIRAAPHALPLPHHKVARVSRDKKSNPPTALRSRTRLRTAPETPLPIAQSKLGGAQRQAELDDPVSRLCPESR
jgi:hypothetical protein